MTMTSMTDVFSGVVTLEGALDYHLQRQVVLNSNIANVDTPGYKPFDLGLTPSVPVGNLGLMRTSEGHLAPYAPPGVMVPYTDATQTPGNDQNAVDMDRELAKLAANTLRYESASELISRRLGMLKYAAGDGTGG